MAGGAEVYAYELYLGMKDSEEWEPFFLAHARLKPHLGVPFQAVNDDPNQTVVTTSGFDYFYGTLPRKNLYSVHFRDYLKLVKPDAVHFQHTLHLGFEMIREVRNTCPDAKIVYTLHEYLPICNANGQMRRVQNNERCKLATPARCHECFPKISPSRFFMRERFIKSQLADVDMFHAPSRFLLERYVDWGIPRDKIWFLEYGRNVLEPVPHRALDGDSSKRNRFGFFGQLNKYKGILPLMEAFEILREREFTDAHLTINGANLDIQPAPFPEQFKDLAQRCGAMVTNAGPYQNEDLSERMQSVDWVVIPSVWWENSPLVIQEAFMHKRPILTSNIGGMAEKVTHDVDGLHFQAGNPADIADTIQRAVSEEGLWDRLMGGIKPVFQVRDSVAQHESLYRDIDGVRAAQRAEAG